MRVEKQKINESVVKNQWTANRDNVSKERRKMANVIRQLRGEETINGGRESEREREKGGYLDFRTRMNWCVW